ncbi:uncharacterized protein LOC132946648 [Metopolophium dirhodum]|uniref:uncharacterized protein LOC132946648 n=1 Tax=Metopolophium dirhodum TaxID=44670 RepID=UPI00298FA92D|nr:uncharacterized protein LOC132946648 [Metopolophium dirhodum]XP_060872677.1 uncharacterized protein LOC132946648 [Metopolophium dirhodum]
MKPDSDKQQETVVDAENNGDPNGSSEAGRDNSSSLDQLRTCSLEFIRSDPGLRYIYDKGFVAGLYGQNLRQLEALVSRESAAGVMSADAAVGSPLQAVGADSWATMVATDTAMESALNAALKVAASSSAIVSGIKRRIFHEQP